MTPEGDPITFDAVVEPLTWGRNVYTVIRADPALEAAATAIGTRRVEGHLDDLLVNVGLNRAPSLTESFVYVGKTLLRRLDVEAGALIRCRLRPVDPDRVLVADDVRAALEAAGAWDAFSSRSPSERRRLVQPVESAATDAGRRRQVARLVDGLR